MGCGDILRKKKNANHDTFKHDDSSEERKDNLENKQHGRLVSLVKIFVKQK
jgi:hypothetical protein